MTRTGIHQDTPPPDPERTLRCRLSPRTTRAARQGTSTLRVRRREAPATTARIGALGRHAQARRRARLAPPRSQPGCGAAWRADGGEDGLGAWGAGGVQKGSGKRGGGCSGGQSRGGGGQRGGLARPTRARACRVARLSDRLRTCQRGRRGRVVAGPKAGWLMAPSVPPSPEGSLCTLPSARLSLPSSVLPLPRQPPPSRRPSYPPALSAHRSRRGPSPPLPRA
jgi:hypothetical protein